MAKQRATTDSPTRVEDLAADIFVNLVQVINGKTPESLAAEAFTKSEAFWKYADSRQEKS